MPLLSCGFDDDEYAPPTAISALLRHYPNATIEQRMYRAGIDTTGTGSIGHFGYFKEKHRATLWADTVD